MNKDWSHLLISKVQSSGCYFIVFVKINSNRNMNMNVEMKLPPNLDQCELHVLTRNVAVNIFILFQAFVCLNKLQNWNKKWLSEFSHREFSWFIRLQWYLYDVYIQYAKLLHKAITLVRCQTHKIYKINRSNLSNWMIFIYSIYLSQTNLPLDYRFSNDLK